MDYFIEQTEGFATWLIKLKDKQAQFAIGRRIDRAATGNLGDIKSVGDGVSEMRIHVGAGYRVYFTTRNQRVLFLLAGGDKSTQSADIRNAIQLAMEL